MNWLVYWLLVGWMSSVYLWGAGSDSDQHQPLLRGVAAVVDDLVSVQVCRSVEHLHRLRVTCQIQNLSLGYSVFGYRYGFEYTDTDSETNTDTDTDGLVISPLSLIAFDSYLGSMSQPSDSM